MTLADKIWEAIQRVSPPVTHEEIVALVQGVAKSDSFISSGSKIAMQDVDDNFVKLSAGHWRLSPYGRFYERKA